MSEGEAGILTSVSFITQVISNPVLGWVADRTNRKSVLEAGAICAMISAGLAFFSNSLGWFFPIIIFSSIGATAFWTIGLAITSEFGSEKERPTYIGLVNTLTAPFTFIAPVIGGLLADGAGYPATFLASAIFGLVTVLVLHFLVTEPARQPVVIAPESTDTY
jgi:MFS family permease